MRASLTVVGGAGHMGSCAVRALVDEGHEVTVVDRRPSDVEGAAFVEGDASDQDSIERAAEDAEVIMNFAGPYYALGDAVARAAISLGKPYVDICDDAEATEELLALDHAARAAGAPLVIGAGMSPGILNAFALRVASGLEELDELLLAWVVGEKGPSAPAPLRHFLYGISRDIPIWRDGARAMVPAFSEESSEEFPFQEPLGTMAVRDVGHPETITLPRALTAREVRNKGALLPPQSTEIFALLRRLGLTSDRTTTVDGMRVVARDFIASFLTDRHNERAGDSAGDVMGLGVRASGKADGRPVVRFLSSAGNMTMADATALPTAAAIPLLLAGQVPPGAQGPEALEPRSWFAELARIAPHLYANIEVWEEDGPRTPTSLHQLAQAQDVADLLRGQA